MCCIFSKPQDWILMFISFVSDSFSELEWTNYQCDEEAFPPFLSYIHRMVLQRPSPLTLLIFVKLRVRVKVS